MDEAIAESSSSVGKKLYFAVSTMFDSANKEIEATSKSKVQIVLIRDSLQLEYLDAIGNCQCQHHIMGIAKNLACLGGLRQVSQG